MNAMTRNRQFLIVCGVLVAMMLGLQACQDHKGRFPRQEMELRYALTGRIEAFRTGWSDPPLPLRWDTLSNWLETSHRVGSLEAVFDDHDLNPEELDQDELLVLLLTGVYMGGEHGEEGWLPLRHFVARGPLMYYIPSPRFIQDADGDGWMEYGVPGHPGFTYFWDRSEGISMGRGDEWANE